jgi:excisionase family DNA binding protein
MSAHVDHTVDLSALSPLLDALADAIAGRVGDRLATHTTVDATATPWLNVDQAAEYLACPPSRIYDLTQQRRLPVHKDGGRSLYRRADLDACVRGASP